jgi:hypothetical protein
MLRQINDNVIAVKTSFGNYFLEDNRICTKGSGQTFIHGHLPPGKWKILGKLDELTDENKRIVLWHWEDISGRDFIKIISSGKLDESFQSLRDANKLYSVNPLGVEYIITDSDPDSFLYQIQKRDRDAWQAAEDNTGDWLIILREGE